MMNQVYYIRLKNTTIVKIDIQIWKEISLLLKFTDFICVQINDKFI